jgi:uncharacterized protein (DUF1015 family)
MADVRPFCALRYNPRRVSLGRVLTQPYDKISNEMRDSYYASDTHNIVRIILGKGQEGDTAEHNVYTRAAATLREWRRSGVIESAGDPAFFVCSQQFTAPGTNERRVRKGFIGLGRLEDYSSGIVFPHERTLAGPKLDRLQLLRHTRTHFEQIFVLYEDERQRLDRLLDEASQAVPDAEVTDEYGVSHSLWTLRSPSALREIQEEMKVRRLIIADGHHRYETALAYRDEMRAGGNAMPDAPHEWLPMTFFNMSSPALTVLPTHRVVRGLREESFTVFLECASQFFRPENAPRDPADFARAVASAGQARVTIGVSADSGSRNVLLGLKDNVDLSTVMADLPGSHRQLDVVILHRILLEGCLGLTEDAVKHEKNITYVREPEKALGAVSTGKAQMAFLLNPVRLDQLRKIVYEGHVMPQKSTDFYPKVLSGLLFYSLEESSPKPS